MIDIIICVGVVLFLLGGFVLSSRTVFDERMRELEAEKYRQATKYHFP